MSFHRTDLGNAERFVRDHRDRVRYVHDRKRWLVWNGKYWAEDQDGEVWRLAVQTVRDMYAEASEVDDEKERAALGKHAVRCEAENRIRAMIECAKSQDGIAITSESLNSNPWLLNVQNGTLNLETCELGDHRPDDMITHCLPVGYDPEAYFPRWYNFLARIFNQDGDLMDYVRRAIGYSLTGSVREQCFFVSYGRGANGKSTLFEVVSTMLGSLAATARFETFLQKKNDVIPHGIARLRGSRMVAASEAEADRRLAESQLKELTGGDTIAARLLYQNEFEFQPTFKLWLRCNHRPRIYGTDRAMWRRVRLIPFNVTIPDDEQDHDLKGKLLDELPGILTWAVSGCRDWRENGLGTCAAVEDHTAAYRADQDVLGPFIEEWVVFGNGNSHEVSKATLYEKYTTWCEGNTETPLRKRTFGERLRERHDGIEDGRGKGGARKWVGLRLRDPVDDELSVSEDDALPF